MNQQIVDYLSQNKDQYAQDALVGQLRQSGHGEEDISAAVTYVYGQSAPVSPEAPTKYAGFWVRFAAVFIDGIVLMPVHIIVGILLAFIAVGENSFISTPVSLLITWIYYILMTHYFQATVGKKAVGIKVQSVNGGNASVGKITLRETVGKLISMFILYIGFIIAAFTGKKQALHDMMAKTVVVYKDPNKKNNTTVIIIVVIVVSIVSIGILALIVLVSLNSAREKAENASVMAMASSTIPSVIICLDDGGTISEPITGQEICNSGAGQDIHNTGSWHDLSSTWPEFKSNDAQWGGCPLIVDNNSEQFSFSYCAMIGDVTVTCTETGCIK